DMPQRKFPEPKPPPDHPGYLPQEFTRFVGREAEIERLRSLVACPAGIPGVSPAASDAPSPGPSFSQRRLVTLTRAGGSGKTRLARELAHRLWAPFHGAIWFVALGDLEDPSLIARRVLEAMRLPPSATVEPFDQVVSALSRQPSLLVLDNLEHLL